jgi:hypothetical protein
MLGKPQIQLQVLEPFRFIKQLHTNSAIQSMLPIYSH